MGAGVIKCPDCAGRQTVLSEDNKEMPCVKCYGKGYIYIITKLVHYSPRKKVTQTHLKPWKDPNSLYCSEKLGEIIGKELPIKSKSECISKKD